MSQFEKPVKPETFIQLKQGSLTEPEAVDWIWNQWIARRKLHLLAGEPGTNKTTLTMALGATMTIAGQWPDGSPCRNPQNIVVWSSEDDFNDTILPRFIANGGDRKRIYYVDGVNDRGNIRGFNPKKDLPLLVKTIDAIGNVGMVTIDSIADCTNGDSHKNSDTRTSLYPIVEAANKYNFAALGVVHFNKGNEASNPLNRIVGSVGFGGMARIVFASAIDPDEPVMQRKLVRVKNNIGMNHGGFKYAIKIDTLPEYPNIEAAHVEWMDKLEGTAKELLGYDPFRDEEKTITRKENEAIEFLVKTLKDIDMLRADEIEKLGKEKNISFRTLNRAKDKASVISCRKYGCWYWMLNPATKN